MGALPLRAWALPLRLGLLQVVRLAKAPTHPPLGDLPPLVLSPSQYHNYTQPRGNFIPYANEERRGSR